MRYLFIDFPILVIKVLLTILVYCTSLLGVWLVTSLVAYIHAPIGLSLLSGILLFPLLPLTWELSHLWRHRQQRQQTSKHLTFGDRLTLRTLSLNLLFIGSLLVLRPQTAFSALSTKGDWMLGNMQGEQVEVVRQALFRLGKGLEELYVAIHPNPDEQYAKDTSGSVSIPQPTSSTQPNSSQHTTSPATTASPVIRREVRNIAGMPVSGTPVPQLELFDQAMVQFMQERSIKAGTLALIKDGRLLLAHGYGYSDPNQQTVIAPDTLMRIASVSKPITAAAVKQLIRQGKISPDTKVFPLLGITPSGGNLADPRLNDITVQHLLDHKGGWDRDVSFDPMLQSAEIAAALGKGSPASSLDIITYMLGQPLQFTPGTRISYSNFGYCVLGRVIEKVTGQSYISYIQQAVLAPLGIKDVELGHTLPQQRSPKEVSWYSDSGKGSSVMEPGKLVPLPDGGFYLEAMDANGGLIASSIALVRFGQAYWLNGEPRRVGESGDGFFFGGLPGTKSMLLQRPDGMNIAVLFNQRRDMNHPSGDEYESIKDIINQVADSLGN